MTLSAYFLFTIQTHEAKKKNILEKTQGRISSKIATYLCSHR